MLGDQASFRKQHIIDGKDDTCWNSDEGKQQFVVFRFASPVNISRVDLTFQGGFAPKSLNIAVGISHPQDPSKMLFKPIADYQVVDTNSEQTFAVQAQHVIALKVSCTEFYDFYGRIIMYHARVYGETINP